jgi:hypothetical protein
MMNIAAAFSSGSKWRKEKEVVAGAENTES